MPDYRLVKHRGKWCVYWREGRKPCRRSAGTADRAEAELFLADFKRQAARAKIGRVTVQTLWERAVDHLGHRPTAKNMRQLWKAMDDHFGGLDPERIATDTVQQYISARRAAGNSDGTIWTELGYLRLALSRGVKDGLICKPSYIARPQQSQPRTAYMRREQFATFLDGCRVPHVRLWAIIAITTGARTSAILQLTWDRVDFEHGLITFSTGQEAYKAKGRATVPMNNSARAAMQEAQQGALSKYVIEWAGQPVKCILRSVGLAAKRAGLPFVTPHVFRHTAAVWMAEGGRSMDEIAQYLGHSDSRITARHYARFSPDYLRQSADVLEIGMGNINRRLKA